MTSLDYPLLCVILAVFSIGFIAGGAEHRRIVRLWPDSNLMSFHRKPGWVRFAILLLSIASASSLYFVFNMAALWHLPDWLDVSLPLWTGALVSVLFGLLTGLAWSAWRRKEPHRNIRALVLTAVLCELALLANSIINQRFIHNQLSAAKAGGRMILQTTGSSCAAASGVNIATLFGLDFSEKEMARLMATRVSGTSPAAIIRGMRKAGLQGTRFEMHPIVPENIPLPSILLVDYPLAGPDSHAVAALRYNTEKKLLEVFDPLTGTIFWDQDTLTRTWRGHGITFKRM